MADPGSDRFDTHDDLTRRRARARVEKKSAWDQAQTVKVCTAWGVLISLVALAVLVVHSLMHR